MITHAVTLPALDGRDPLGWLAALGTLRLLTDHSGLAPRLSYDETTGAALLHSPLATMDDIVTTLVGIIGTIPDDGVIPGLTATIPLAKTGTAPDPMRMPRNNLRTTFNRLTHQFPEPATSRWLAALVTDLAIDTKGRAALTPYTAPAGQQSLRSFFTKPLAEVHRNPTLLIHEALNRWRRIDGYTGEYLDHRVLRDAANHPSGQSTEAGVPGATWLATMALPLLRLTGTSHTTQATCWHTIPGQRQPVMIWPLWRQPLDTHSIQTLLEHPQLRPRQTPQGITLDRKPWPPLGVFTVAAAIRQPIEERKSAGVLAPTTIRITG